MPQHSNAEIKAGAFVLVCITALVIGLFLISSKLDIRSGSKKEKLLVFNDVGGLKIDSVVHYAGIPAGFVKSTTMDLRDKSKPPIARVVISIHDNIELREDDSASIATTLMGDTAIFIRPGKGKSLSPDAPLRGKDPVNISDVVEDLQNKMDTVMKSGVLEKVNSIATNIDHASLTLSQILSENKSPIKDTISNINTAAGNIGELIKDSKPIISETLDKIKGSVVQINTLIEENKTNISEAITNFKDSVNQVKEAMAGLQGILGDANFQGDAKSLVSNLNKDAAEIQEYLTNNKDNIKTIVDNLKNASDTLQGTLAKAEKLIGTSADVVEEKKNDLAETLENIRDLSAAAKNFAENLEKNPWKLVRKPSAKESTNSLMMVAAERFDIAAKRLQSAVNTLGEKAAQSPAQAAQLRQILEDLKTNIDNLGKFEDQYKIKGSFEKSNKRP